MNFLLYMDDERGIRMSIKLENRDAPRFIVSDGRRLRIYKSYTGILGYFDGASLAVGKSRNEFAKETFAKTVAARAIYDAAVENPVALYGEIWSLASDNLRLDAGDSAAETVLEILRDYRCSIPLVSEHGFLLKVDEDTPVSTLFL